MTQPSTETIHDRESLENRLRFLLPIAKPVSNRVVADPLLFVRISATHTEPHVTCEFPGEGQPPTG